MQANSIQFEVAFGNIWGPTIENIHCIKKLLVIPTAYVNEHFCLRIMFWSAVPNLYPLGLRNAQTLLETTRGDNF